MNKSAIRDGKAESDKAGGLKTGKNKNRGKKY